YYMRITADAPEAETDLLRQAQAYSRLANIQSLLGDSEAAESPQRRALALWQQLAADHPDEPKYRHGLIKSHNALGHLPAGLGRSQAAGPPSRAGLTVLEQAPPDFRASEAGRDFLAILHNSLGVLFQQLEGCEENARTHLQTAASVYQRLMAGFPRNLRYGAR